MILIVTTLCEFGWEDGRSFLSPCFRRTRSSIRGGHSMSDIILPLPLPNLDRPFQPGVTDPIWPSTPPHGVDAGRYEAVYSGQLARQRHLHIVTANVTGDSRNDLEDLLLQLNRFAKHEMTRTVPIGDD